MLMLARLLLKIFRFGKVQSKKKMKIQFLSPSPYYILYISIFSKCVEWSNSLRNAMKKILVLGGGEYPSALT